ncbi:MAG: UV DNA damage repair endonuclease UvsE, partial [Marivivens sp.]|nr:UV DNA damage repair endonuclease UvsE [Marivivens sp.]
MRKLSDEAQLLKLTEVVTHNLEALSRAIERFQYQPSELRMFRIGSGVLPLRTHPEF